MSIGELQVQTSGPPVGLNTLSGEDKGSILMKALTDAFINAISPLQNSLQQMVGLLQGILDVNVEHLNIVKGQIEGNEARSAEAAAEGARSASTSAAGLPEEDEFDFSKIDGGGLGGLLKAALLGLGLYFQDTVQGIIRSVKLPAILRVLNKSLRIFTLGFVNLGKTLRGFGSRLIGKDSPIRKFFTRIKEFFGKFPILSKVLRVALRFIALPLTVLFGIVDAVKGFMEGYKDRGFIDGILTAIGNVLGGLFGTVLDLIKDIAAFVLEKLGFENAAEALKDFSFKELIKNAFGGIVNFFENLPEIINSAIRSLPGGDFLADKFGLGTTEQKREAILGESGTKSIQKDVIDQLAEEGQASGDRSFEKKVGGVQTKFNKSFEDLTPEQQAQVMNRVKEIQAEKLEAAGLTETEKAVVATDRSIPGETSAEQVKELIKQGVLPPTGELAVEKEIVDGKVATVSAKGDVVIPEKKLGDLLNQEGAQNMAPVVAPTINKGGDNNSTTNITNVNGGSGGGGDFSMHNQDPSSFRLQSAQAEL
tara:strand:+ start:5655 stop:7262 length:1608 start_codon:yes stop_codon:yes gene_type:complete